MSICKVCVPGSRFKNFASPRSYFRAHMMRQDGLRLGLGYHDKEEQSRTWQHLQPPQNSRSRAIF